MLSGSQYYKNRDKCMRWSFPLKHSKKNYTASLQAFVKYCMMSNHDLCAECYKPVRPRQEGLQCDGCFTWQHRTCNTGILQREYREAVKSGQEIDWHCKNCTIGGVTAA